MRKVYGIGETVLDIIFKNTQPIGAKAGGSVLNSMVSLGRLNANVQFISETGNDKVGQIIKDFLEENNVHTKYMQTFISGKSALSLAFLNDKNDAHYDFYKDYPNQRLQGPIPEFTKNDLFMFGSFYGVSPVLRHGMMNILMAAKNTGAFIYYDPNFRSSHLHELPELKPYILENIKISNLVRGSDEDFKNIYGIEEPRAVYNQLKDFCPMLIITENAKGVHFFNHGSYKYYAVKNIEPISTIGAGDTFNAGVIYGMLKHNVDIQNSSLLHANDWDRIIETAILFSTNVCLSLDNYIDVELAKKYSLGS